MAEIWQRLRQRKLAQWALAYVAGAWVLLQVLGLASDSFDWPRVVMRLSFGLALLGFGVALVLAWYHGERGEQKVGGTELVILSLLLAVGGGVLWQVGHERSARPAAALPASNPPTTPAAGASPTVPISQKSIAVLPFANLSADKDNAYFADGIQNEILTRLARIGALKVISHTSTQRYASSPDNLPEIARQLGVAHIVEGTVQKIGDSVRINVQLIEASTDAHLWAEIYDRKLVDVFSIQSEVAAAIATALQAKLTQDEQRAVALKPTDNVAAYDAYLRGLSFASRSFRSSRNSARARDHFLEAVSLDPNFVEAWTKLIDEQSALYQRFVSRTPAALELMQRGVETVARLRPGSGEAWLSQGFYRYRVLNDYPAAIEAFEQAARQLPNDAAVQGVLTYVARRTGKLDEALERARRAEQLDPGNPTWPTVLGGILAGVRRYPESRAAYDRALNLAPDDNNVAAAKAAVFQQEGNLEAAGALLSALPELGDNDLDALGVHMEQLRLLRKFDQVTALCKRGLAKVESRPVSSLDAESTVNWHLCVAEAERQGGNLETAVVAYRRVLSLARKQPTADAFAVAGTLASTYAGLGDKTAALREAERAVQLNGFDIIRLLWAKSRLARIHARFGDADAAISLLETLLVQPYGPSRGSLKLSADWDPIRKDPRFQKLIAQAEAEAKP